MFNQKSTLEIASMSCQLSCWISWSEALHFRSKVQTLQDQVSGKEKRKNLQIAMKIGAGESMNHNNCLLQWFSFPVPICCSHVRVSACMQPAIILQMVFNGFSSKEYIAWIRILRNLVYRFKWIHSEIWLHPPNLSVCCRLHFCIIRLYNPVRYNHLLPNPVELLVGRSAAAETLFDSDLIKSVWRCVCVFVCMRKSGNPTLGSH